MRSLFLMLWLIVMLLPSILSGDAPHFGRMVGAAPVLAILAGQGAHWVGDVARALLSTRGGNPSGLPVDRSRVLGYLPLVILLAASAFLTIRDYFFTYAQLPDLPTDFYLPDWQLGRYAAAQPDENDIYLTPTQAEMATIYFAMSDPERLRSYNGSWGLIPAGRPNHALVYLVRPEEEASLRSLASFFPDGRWGAAGSEFVSFHVDANARRIHAPNTAGHTWEGLVRLDGWQWERQDQQLQITLYWQAEGAMDRDYTAFIHLISPENMIASQRDRQPQGYPTSDWKPGEVVVDHFILQLPADLSPVGYELRTGWYYLPTLEPLGNTYTLGEWRPDSKGMNYSVGEPRLAVGASLH